MGHVAYLSYLLPPSARDRECQGQYLVQRPLQRRDFPTCDGTFACSVKINPLLEPRSSVLSCTLVVVWDQRTASGFLTFSLEICWHVGEKSSSQVLQYFVWYRNRCRKNTVFSICYDMKTLRSLSNPNPCIPTKKMSGRGCGRQSNASFIQKAE